MTARNDITGDLLKSKTNNDAFRDGWDRIFGNTPAVEPPTIMLRMRRGHYEVQLPAEIVEQVAAGVGTKLQVTVENGAIILKP
jgi:hypothetical protein